MTMCSDMVLLLLSAWVWLTATFVTDIKTSPTVLLQFCIGDWRQNLTLCA
jgi:hypothetical protein